MRCIYDTPNGRKMIKTISGLRSLVVFNLLMFMGGWLFSSNPSSNSGRLLLSGDDGKRVTRLHQKFSVVQIMPSWGKARGSYPFSDAIIILKKP
jgi:hypothetical protein